MKVLTIKEPWATLIIEGYKQYEFRTWKTNYRGKILIHTSLNSEKNNIEKFKKYHLDFSKGEIIGEAELVDCILVDKDFNQKLLKIDSTIYGQSTHEMKYAWKLENIKKYDRKISIKGKLGLWNYNGDKDN